LPVRIFDDLLVFLLLAVDCIYRIEFDILFSDLVVEILFFKGFEVLFKPFSVHFGVNVTRISWKSPLKRKLIFNIVVNLINYLF